MRDIVLASLASALALSIFAPKTAGGTVYVNNGSLSDLSDPAGWTPNSGPPGSSDTAQWDSSGGARSDYTVPLTGFSWGSLVVKDAPGPVTITGAGGAALTLGSVVDLSAATANLTVNSPVVFSAPQNWWIASGRTISVGGDIDNGANRLSIALGGNAVISGNIGTGSGGVLMNGSGTLTLSGDNGYTGGTTLALGTIKLGSATALGSSTTPGGVNFFGGKLDVNNLGAASGTVTASVGALSLTDRSFLQLDHTGATAVLAFSSASAPTPGKTLTIDDWAGTVGSSGGASNDRLTFSGSVDPSFLADVVWTHVNGSAQPINGALLVGGQLVPVPEPSTVLAACFVLGALVWSERRRFARPA